MDLLNCDIASYWNDILVNSKLVGSLKFLENIEDKEERLFSLLMRVVFLSIMGLKKEKDEAKDQLQHLLKCFKSVEVETVQCSKNCKLKQKLLDSINKADVWRKCDNNSDVTRNSAVDMSLLDSKSCVVRTNSAVDTSLLDRRIDVNTTPSLHTKKTPKSKKQHILVPETQYNNAMNILNQTEHIIPETMYYNTNMTEMDHLDCQQINSSPSLLGEVKRNVQATESPSKWIQPAVLKKKSPNITTKFNHKKRSIVSEIDFDLKSTSKKMKQTKISVNSFMKNTNKTTATDGCKILRAISSVDAEEKLRIQKAIENSLASPECQVMMKEKMREIDKISPKNKSNKRKSFTSPILKNVDNKNQCDLQKSSKSLNTQPDKGSRLKMKSPQKGPAPQHSPSPKKYKSNSPRFARSMKTVKICEDELLNELQSSPIKSPKKVKKPLPKMISFEDSFDFVGKAAPKIVSKSTVIRKRCDRNALEGWSCHECRDYYQSRNLTEEEKKAAMNRCSRHRSDHNVINNTPSNFWNPEWSD